MDESQSRTRIKPLLGEQIARHFPATFCSSFVPWSPRELSPFSRQASRCNQQIPSDLAATVKRTGKPYNAYLTNRLYTILVLRISAENGSEERLGYS